MEVFKTLKPNSPGTKRLTRKYGDKLVAVRYRKGINPNFIYTTAEIIIDRKQYTPETSQAPENPVITQQKVHIYIAPWELELRMDMKSENAKWDAKNKLWILEYDKVCKLGLNERIKDVPG